MKSSAIILSDIAASTLGIALFILLLASALQHDPAPASPGLKGEVETAFKSFSAPPVSAREMVAAFYARTASAPQTTALIDVLQDRIVIRANGSHDLFMLADPGVAPAFRKRMSQLQMQGTALTLFVFNTPALNAIHHALPPDLRNTKVIMVPAALRSTSPRGGQGWLPRFQELEQARLTRAEFEVSLRRLLLASPGATPTPDTASQRQSLTDRLSQWWRILSLCTTLCVTGIVIARTERRARNRTR